MVVERFLLNQMLSVFTMVGKAAYTARKVVMAMISPCNASVRCSECNNETLHSHFLCQIRAACKVSQCFAKACIGAILHADHNENQCRRAKAKQRTRSCTAMPIQALLARRDKSRIAITEQSLMPQATSSQGCYKHMPPIGPDAT